jgi:hypothetical protein
MSQESQAIEISIESAKKGIAKNAALSRLSKNKDFQTVIDTGYFSDEASRLVLLRGAPQMQTPEHQSGLMREIDAIAYLRQYFSTISIQGQQLERSLKADEITRDEIAEEEGQ